MKKLTFLSFICLGLFLAAGLSHAQVPTGPIAKVSVLASGKILLNGQKTTLTKLDTALKKLKTENGIVWYYRENAQAPAPPKAMEVIKLVVKYKLPISLSTKPDFSDYVGKDGYTHPRKH